MTSKLQRERIKYRMKTGSEEGGERNIKKEVVER